MVRAVAARVRLGATPRIAVEREVEERSTHTPFLGPVNDCCVLFFQAVDGTATHPTAEF